MERRRELIFLCSSPGNRCWNLILSEFSPNFYCSTNRHLVKLPSSIISRFAGPNGFSLLNSSIMDYLRSGQVIFSLRSLTCLVSRWMLGRSRGMLIRSLNILVMHCHSLRWLSSSSCTLVETHQDTSLFSSHNQCSYPKKESPRKFKVYVRVDNGEHASTGERALQPFSSSCTLVETHQDTSLFSSHNQCSYPKRESPRKFKAYVRVDNGEHASTGERALQPFSSSCTVVETHQDTSLFSSQSSHNQCS
ncbi:uncharacterized protein [Solanum tuberosum]|uniref:uncharacterized protein n=1 Tax=Solanum tuberosum TaxID=4113 RepID=UPI0003D29008|nr:PREDICTED: uncharacterized protein LOC102603335 [Solanum tuberosum]